MAFPNTSHTPSWGDLNVAMNSLVREGVILSYTTGEKLRGVLTALNVGVDTGADEAEVLRRVRGALPGAFAQMKVRTQERPSSTDQSSAARIDSKPIPTTPATSVGVGEG